MTKLTIICGIVTSICVTIAGLMMLAVAIFWMITGDIP